MSNEEARQGSDAETQGVLAALRRARLRAERVALMTGTSLVVLVDGKLVLVPPRPDEVLREQEAALAAKK